MKARKDDQQKIRFDLIPQIAELLHARVLTFGATKYAPDQWRDLLGWRRRYRAALRRHVNADARGEYLDDETGLPHLAHAMCCISFLVELEARLRNGEPVPDPDAAEPAETSSKPSPAAKRVHGARRSRKPIPPTGPCPY